MDGQIAIRAHYERFPATVKGAFVLSAEGPDPHQVRIESARIAEVTGRGVRSIDLEAVTLEVAPRLDLFVPFEFPITELGPGWYELACEVLIDGVPDQVRPGERFPVAWPRATMRRGSVTVGTSVTAGDGDVRIEQVELGGDSIKVAYTAAGPVSMKFSAGGTSLPVIDEGFNEEAGRGKIVAYPVLKTQDDLVIDIRGADGPVDIKLP
jgi:hypothetical protein